MTPHDICNLFGMDKHAFDLCRLVSPAHPSPEPHVGASAGAASGKDSRQVTGCKADQRVFGDKGCHHNFTDLAIGNQIAGAWANNFDQQPFVDNQPFAGRRFVSNIADIRTGIHLTTNHTHVFKVFAQAREKGFTANQPFGQRGNVFAHFLGFLQNDLEK